MYFGTCKLELPRNDRVLSQPWRENQLENTNRRQNYHFKAILKLQGVIIICELLLSQKGHSCVEATLMLKMLLLTFRNIVQKGNARHEYW